MYAAWVPVSEYTNMQVYTYVIRLVNQCLIRHVNQWEQLYVLCMYTYVHILKYTVYRTRRKLLNVLTFFFISLRIMSGLMTSIHGIQITIRTTRNVWNLACKTTTSTYESVTDVSYIIQMVDDTANTTLAWAIKTKKILIILWIYIYIYTHNQYYVYIVHLFYIHKGYAMEPTFYYLYLGLPAFQYIYPNACSFKWALWDIESKFVYLLYKEMHQQWGTNNIQLPDRWRHLGSGGSRVRWFVYITTLLLRDASWVLILHCGPPEPPQRHLYC